MKLTTLLENPGPNCKKALLKFQQAVIDAGYDATVVNAYTLKIDIVLERDQLNTSGARTTIAEAADRAWFLIMSELRSFPGFVEQQHAAGWEVGLLFNERIALYIPDDLKNCAGGVGQQWLEEHS